MDQQMQRLNSHLPLSISFWFIGRQRTATLTHSDGDGSTIFSFEVFLDFVIVIFENICLLREIRLFGLLIKLLISKKSINLRAY